MPVGQILGCCGIKLYASAGEGVFDTLQQHRALIWFKQVCIGSHEYVQQCKLANVAVHDNSWLVQFCSVDAPGLQ